MIDRASRQLQALALALVVSGTGACVTQPVAPQETPEKILEQANAKRDVGMDHLAKGRTAMAIRELLNSERLNPDDPETQLWLGRPTGARACSRRHSVPKYCSITMPTCVPWANIAGALRRSGTTSS